MDRPGAAKRIRISALHQIGRVGLPADLLILGGEQHPCEPTGADAITRGPSLDERPTQADAADLVEG